MKIWIGQSLLEHLNSWSKFTLKPTVVESHYLSNFWILKWRNKPQKWNLCEKLGKTGTSWKFWLLGQDLCKSQFFRNWTVCTISELQMKKRISKSECTRKTKWNRPFLKILTFWSKSKLYLVKTFSFSSFFLFKIFLQPVRTGSGFQVGQTG